MPDVVSTSEPSPESAGACVVTGKSFEVSPQKICADRDTDEKHQAYIQPSWRLYLKKKKKSWDCAINILTTKQSRWESSQNRKTGERSSWLVKAETLFARIVRHCHMHYGTGVRTLPSTGFHWMKVCFHWCSPIARNTAKRDKLWTGEMVTFPTLIMETLINLCPHAPKRTVAAAVVLKSKKNKVLKIKNLY